MQPQIQQARTVFYGVLSLLFMDKAAQKNPGELTRLLKAIEESGFDEAACQAAATLKAACEDAEGLEAMDEEFSELFILPFGQRIPLTASIYYDEREAGAPLLKVKEVLNLAALRRESARFSDHEDNFGFVFTLMARLIRQGVEEDDNAQLVAANALYEGVIKSYAPLFADRVLSAPRAHLYKAAALLLNRFLIAEAEFYETLGAMAGTSMPRSGARL